MDQFFKIWNLRVNHPKCGTILIRRTYNHLNSASTKNLKTFGLTAKAPGTDELIHVPHKTTVKYLGVHIDYLAKLNGHVEI